MYNTPSHKHASLQGVGESLEKGASVARDLGEKFSQQEDGTTTTRTKVYVKASDTLEEVKKKYWGDEKDAEAKVQQQCLSKGNKTLDDNNTLEKLGIQTGDTLHIADNGTTCTHIFVTDAKEAKAITPTVAALRVLQNALHVMAKYASIGPVIIGVLMTAINMADQVSGVMSDHGFAAVHTPYISDAATELQSALFHGVHNHLFEREIGSYGPATAAHGSAGSDNSNSNSSTTMPAWGSTDHAQYSRAARQQEYRAFKTMHALGRFLGEVEIVLEAAKDTERDKLGAGTATWFWRGTKGLMAYVPLTYWYLRVLSAVEHHTGWACVRGAGKKASRELVALTHAYNEDAHLVLTRELLAVTSRVSDTARDVRFPNARDGKWHSRSGRKRKAAYDDVVLPHCLHLHGGEMRAIGKSMLGPNPDQDNAMKGRPLSALRFHDFRDAFDPDSHPTQTMMGPQGGHNKKLVRWFLPVAGDLRELSTAAGYRACGERLRFIQHALVSLLNLLHDPQFKPYAGAGTRGGCAPNCKLLPPAREHKGWAEQVPPGGEDEPRHEQCGEETPARKNAGS